MLSIVICTRNRCEILADCLESLRDQCSTLTDVQIVVVDNNSSDDTKVIVQDYFTKFVDLRYVIESRIGLSFARNKGVACSSQPWLMFLDDDAKAAVDLVPRALSIINGYDFHCFGGRYLAWHRFGIPKWLPENFGDMPLLRSDIGQIHTPSLAGGILVMQRAVLREIGGFSTKLGMSDQIGYSEDTEMQLRMIRAGFHLGFDPKLIIYHCVMPHKFSPIWHLNAYFAKGRDRLKDEGSKEKYKALLSLFGEVILVVLVRMPYALFRLLLGSNYYWQNALVSIFYRFYYLMGCVKAANEFMRVRISIAR